LVDYNSTTEALSSEPILAKVLSNKIGFKSGALGALTPKPCGEEGSGLGRQVTVKLASMKQESNININGK